MNLDAGSLVASFVVSSVGFVLLVYGKRMSRIPHLVVGLVLFVYPYFVSSVLLTFGIGVVLLALLWILVQKGV